MDVGALASALIGAQVGRAQLAVAARMLKMNDGEAADSALQLLNAAKGNMERLANISAGIGRSVDISV
jgi:hypothetical protein